MTRLNELRQKFVITQKTIEKLNEEYVGKIKGEAYQKRYTQLIKKLEDIKKLVLLYGTQGNVIIVKGKRDRLSRRNNKLRIPEKFTLYLVNVEPEDVPGLLKYRVKSVKDYTIEIKKPGELIINR